MTGIKGEVTDMDESRVEERLRELLKTIVNDEFEVDGVLTFCSLPKNRVKLLEFIEDGHTGRIEVMDMASILSIESGTSEGELEEE